MRILRKRRNTKKIIISDEMNRKEKVSLCFKRLANCTTRLASPAWLAVDTRLQVTKQLKLEVMQMKVICLASGRVELNCLLPGGGRRDGRVAGE